MPAPEKGVNFSGLVGHFSLGAGLDRASVRAGDSVTLTVTVSGTGNVMDAAIPVVTVPDSFKVYDDVPQEKITLTQEGYQGDKTFKRAIVPMAAGDFSLEPVTLTYFNTDTQDYETLSTPPLALAVEPAAQGSAPAAPAPSSMGPEQGVQKQTVEFTGDDILALKEGTGVLVDHRSLSLGRFVLLLALPLVLLLVFRGANHFFKQEESFASLMERKARQALKAAGTKNLPDPDFLRNLYTALVAKVRSRGNLPGETITAGEISQILSDAGCRDGQIREAIAMLHDIESARYGGGLFDANLKKSLLQRVRQLALCLVCLVLFAAVPGPGRADDSGTLFLQGVQLYKSGQFQDAAVAFEQVAANGIKNGQLYYNIGNACLKAGDLGHAILWYERAVKLTPRDPDLRYNLDHARGLVTDVSPERNIDLLALVFFWDDYLPPGTIAQGAVLLWCCFIVHAGVRMFRKKRVFTLAGSILCVLSVVVVATAIFDYYHQYAQSQAVILVDAAPVRSGYSDEATELFILHAGTKVRVERAEKAFLRISFSKDKVGWVKASLAGII
jgi:tetratricopeptide (TPR) repeat protein